MQADSDAARSCGKKIKYKTRGEARRGKRILQRISGHVLDIYICRHCGYRHVGHRLRDVPAAMGPDRDLPTGEEPAP